MMRTFHGIESDDEDKTKETPVKKMSLLNRVTARHFAEKKDAQEAKVKKEEDMGIENAKTDNVKYDLKQEGKMLSFEERVLGKLQRAAVLEISDSEDSNLPGLEELHKRKKDDSKTQDTAGGTQGLKTIPMTMEEAMKDDVFRGAMEMELNSSCELGTQTIQSNKKSHRHPQETGLYRGQEVGLTGYTQVRRHTRPY
mgnify:CR=1 FL=1